MNDRGGVPHPYFLDHSPIIANTYINTDLKNPSVGDRFPLDNSIRHPIYENAYPQKFNTAIVSLANDPSKNSNKKKKNANKDSDEDEAESEENDEDDEDDQNDDDDDDGEVEGRHQDENVRYKSNQERSQLSSKSKQQTRRIVIKVKPQIKKAQQTRRLPQKKGVIQVYGVYQPSFDTEFSQTSTQIGTGPVRLFDHDYDGADVRYQKEKPKTPTSSVSPTRKPKPVAPPPKQKLVSSKPDSEQASNSDEEDDDEQQDDVDVEAEEEEDQEEDEEDDDTEDYKKRSIAQKSQSQPHPHNLKKLQQLRQNPSYRRPHNFATTPSYGSYPAPRPEEYYHNGKPLRERPPTPVYSKPVIYKPRPELRRLNIVHAPGSALMRPRPRPGRYQRY